MNELLNFKETVQERLEEAFSGQTTDVASVSITEQGGYFYYTLYAWVDGKLLIGAGLSQGKAVDKAIASMADYDSTFERVSIERADDDK